MVAEETAGAQEPGQTAEQDEEEEEEEEEEQDVAMPWTGLSKLPVCMSETSAVEKGMLARCTPCKHSILKCVLECFNADPLTTGSKSTYMLTPMQERSDVLDCLGELKEAGFKQLNVLLLGE